jgi:hypothetical protein
MPVLAGSRSCAWLLSPVRLGQCCDSAITSFMQKLADRIFWYTECPRSKLDGLKLAFLDPAVNRFRVDSCPFRHFAHSQ